MTYLLLRDIISEEIFIQQGALLIYIATDVEAAGTLLGIHPTLSLGACVVTKELLCFEEYVNQGLVFYAELKPYSDQFDISAMRVGCSHLICLKKLRWSDARYDPKSPIFNPLLVLQKMQSDCEEPRLALQRFATWVRGVRNGQNVEGVTDTVFFDSGHINLGFGQHAKSPSPFGHKGIDLTSLYKGHTGRSNARLSELSVPDERKRPHRADHDAVYLAQEARVLLYEILHW